MRTIRTLALAVVGTLALSLSMQAPASAEHPGAYGYGLPYQTFGGYFGRPYATGRIPTPPYFSIHPPVYYSYPVPRTYGHSPYAYPGTFRTPELEKPKTAMMINPHTKAAKVKKDQPRTASTGDEYLSRMQLVVNPHVTSGSKADQSMLTSTEK